MAATLVIGVGGTGTQVLVRVHERLIRDSGGIPRNVGLLAIDARKWPEVTPFPPKVPFTSTEPINYPSTWPQFSDDLSQWWPDRIPRGVPDITFAGGCGAIRAHGRFFAFYFAQRIEQTIRQVLNTMRAADPHGAPPEKDLLVIISGSLGNGTGGGIFMDVGAMSKRISGQMFTSVRVAAMSLASTVTMVGNVNDLRVRVAANGLAALIETQYEFNRMDRSGEGVARPYDPYVFRAWNGTQITSYEADTNVPPTKSVAPLDFMYLFEEYDRVGQRHDFKSLRQAMAESITALCGTADMGLRALDGHVQASSGARRFGSLCAVRLVVPQMDLADYVVPELAISSMNLAVTADQMAWGHLLSESLPGGEVVLPAQGSDVKKSVSAFVEQVLRIREVGSRDRASSEVNQLLDRFSDDEQVLRDEVRQAAETLNVSDSAASISNNARALVSVVEDQLDRISGEWQRLLVGDVDSFWLRMPADSTHHDQAGVRWLINWRVRRFAEAGAFGLLANWLVELASQIDENKRSIEESEIELFLAKFDLDDRDGVEAALKKRDFAGGLQRISTEADSFLAVLKVQRLRNEAARLREEAERHLELAVAHSKTREAIRFYDQVLDHVNALASSAQRVTARLSQESSLFPLQDRSRKASRRLERMVGERSNVDEGQPTELALAGSEAMRRDLVETLRQGVGTSPLDILAAIPKVNVGFLANELSIDRMKAADLALDLPEDSDFDVTYRKALVTAVQQITELALNAQCDVDRVLEAEALAVTRQYEAAFVVNQGALGDRARGLLQIEMVERYGPNVFEYVRDLDWELDAERARKEAVPVLVAGRLLRYVTYAAPHWGIQHGVRDAAKLARFAFFNYGRQSNVLGLAVEKMHELNLMGESGHIQAASTPTLQGGRIDILSLDIGASLDALGCVSQLQESYEKAMRMTDFSPHTTKHYESVGRQWLQERLPKPPGATLVFLASYSDLIGEKTGGNFSLAVDILSARTEDDSAVAWSGYKAGYQLPRGIVDVSDWLDGEKKEARELRAALKHLCWRALQAKVESVGSWVTVADDLNAFAAAIRDRESSPWGKNQVIVNQAREALEALSHELKDTKGAVKPRILR